MTHPQGLAPPREWWTEQKGRASTKQYQEWLASSEEKAKRSKFNANVGPRPDLGHSLKSNLEANTERLLRFIGYTPWTEKGEPSSIGKFYRYEGQEYLLTTKRGKTVGYKPDFHLWVDGVRTIWESKGCLDARSKRALTLMAKQYHELPITLITREELSARAAEALYAARRRGEKVLEIPGWENI